MPNWCENIVTFTGPRAKLDALIEGAGKRELLNTIRPMPDSVFRGNVGTAEREEHGSNNWYDWSVEHWGTKWEVGDVDVDDEGESVTFRFDSAWSPPVEAYRYAEEEQGLSVDAKYCETGFYFIGRYGAGVEASLPIDECEDEDLRDTFAFAFEEWDDD
jgi:hypothetical protein